MGLIGSRVNYHHKTDSVSQNKHDEHWEQQINLKAIKVFHAENCLKFKSHLRSNMVWDRGFTAASWDQSSPWLALAGLHTLRPSMLLHPDWKLKHPAPAMTVSDGYKGKSSTDSGSWLEEFKRESTFTDRALLTLNFNSGLSFLLADIWDFSFIGFYFSILEETLFVFVLLKTIFLKVTRL